MDRADLRAAIASISRITRDYPGGIPLRLIKATTGIQIAFVGQSVLLAAEQELLNAAISKGLQLPLESVSFVLTSAAGSQKLPPIVVVLGGEAWSVASLGELPERGRTVEIGQSNYILTHSLDAVLKEQNLKREFWTDLKSALSLMAE